MSFLNIVIPTYNRFECVARLAVELNGICQNFDVSVTIVDDGSDNECVQLLKKLDIECRQINFEFLENNVGGGKARNYGWKAIKSEWVWFFDDDDFVTKEVVEDVVREIHKEKERDIIFLSSRNSDDKKITVQKVEDGLYRHLSRYGQRVNTSCSLFRSSLLSKIGGWDPVLVAGQDTDLFLRASEFSDALILGFVVDVHHDRNDRITVNPKKQMKGKVQFLLKNWKRLHWSRKARYLVSVAFFWPYIRKIVL